MAETPDPGPNRGVAVRARGRAARRILRWLDENGAAAAVTSAPRTVARPLLPPSADPAPTIPGVGSHGPRELSDGEIDAGRGERLQELIQAGLVTWGLHSYGSPLVHAYDGDRGRLAVGRYCSFAVGVEVFLGGEHRTEWVSTYPLREVFGLPGSGTKGHPASRGDVLIGNDVWLGRGCVLRSGVHVGDGAVIATNAMVSRDVRPYAVVAGNPAREVRRRFSDLEVADLLRTAWWDWPHEEVIAAVDVLNGGSPADLLRWREARAAGQPAAGPHGS